MRADPVPTADLPDLWAKGAPTAPGAPYHPLVHHLIDVGGVARVVWAEILTEAARAWFGRQIGLAAEAAGRWACFLAASHDVGKACPGFQRRQQGAPKHATVSAVALRAALTAPPWCLERALGHRLAVVVGAHHGVAPRHKDLQDTGKSPRAIGGGPWAAQRDDLIRRCADHGGVAPGSVPAALTGAGALWLAGFISVVDWIGSNEEFFPYAATWGAPPGEEAVAAYAAEAEPRARNALAALG